MSDTFLVDSENHLLHVGDRVEMQDGKVGPIIAIGPPTSGRAGERPTLVVDRGEDKVRFMGSATDTPTEANEFRPQADGTGTFQFPTLSLVMSGTYGDDEPMNDRFGSEDAFAFASAAAALALPLLDAQILYDLLVSDLSNDGADAVLATPTGDDVADRKRMMAVMLWEQVNEQTFTDTYLPSTL